MNGMVTSDQVKNQAVNYVWAAGDIKYSQEAECIMGRIGDKLCVIDIATKSNLAAINTVIQVANVANLKLDKKPENIGQAFEQMQEFNHQFFEKLDDDKKKALVKATLQVEGHDYITNSFGREHENVQVAQV